MSEDLRAVRLEKLQKLKENGYEVYPDKYERTHTLAGAKKLEMDMNVKVCGRIMMIRHIGRLIFVKLQDWSGHLQIVLEENTVGKESFKDFVKLIDLGDFVGAEGKMFTTKHGEISVLVSQWTFLGKGLHPLPSKWHGLEDKETCYRERYLDLIMNEDTKNRFKFRSEFIKEIRKFYWENNFVEVETPTLTHTATGANAKPYVTHNNALDIDIYLRISQELPHKMLITGGYDRLFEIGKAFRNEGIDPSHLPEHTHFEHYVAYWNYKDNMKFTEELFDHLFSTLDFLPNDRKIQIKDKEGKEQIVDFSTPFKRVSFVEIIEKETGVNVMKIKDEKEMKSILKSKKIKIDDIDKMSLATIIDHFYKKMVRPNLIQPTFVYDYPKFMQPLARVNNENKDIVDQFQLVINGWEIVKAYSELVDPIDQAERFKEQLAVKASGDEEAMEGDDEYIKCMEYGMPPISGWGMGLDRIITLFTQQENLRDCVLFPLMRPEGKEKKK